MPTKSVSNSYDDILLMAESYTQEERRLRIETTNSLAPTKIWNYDYSIAQWVEKI